MSSDFVRYSPEIETIDQNIEEYITRIIEFWEKLVGESPKTESTGRASAPVLVATSPGNRRCLRARFCPVRAG
jgi:hypothetical protein